MVFVSHLQNEDEKRRLIDLIRVLFNVLYCAKVNRDKVNGKYDKYTGYADDRDPEFTLIL